MEKVYIFLIKKHCIVSTAKSSVLILTRKLIYYPL